MKHIQVQLFSKEFLARMGVFAGLLVWQGKILGKFGGFPW